MAPVERAQYAIRDSAGRSNSPKAAVLKALFDDVDDGLLELGLG